MFLIDRIKKPTSTARKRGERGATVVVVTLLMVSLLGMAAISIDFAVASSDKAEAQNAADAAALAIARQCAVRATECNPSAGNSEIDWAISQNAPGKSGTMTPATPAFSNRRVTVNITGTRESFFAQAADFAGAGDGFNVGARATATWDEYAVDGAVDFPVGIGYCDWLDRERGVGDSPDHARYYFGTLAHPWGQRNLDKSCHVDIPGVTQGPQTVRHRGNAMGWMRTMADPGFCGFRASFLDVILNWINFSNGIDGFCTSEAAALRPNQVIMVPIYGITDQVFIIRLPWHEVHITVSDELIIFGFAPFEIREFRRHSTLLGESSHNRCENMWSTAFLIRKCIGMDGQFIRTSRPIEGWTYGKTYGGRPVADLGAVKAQLTE